ncbi:hypothetical protein LNJ05_03515 [Tenacibaculum finnmarkense genomovar ulcerans]|uniref:hypothetical protein n=1 Tax=Tenacibaculum finnmarkense TaxID=2781243 RepID=UPI001E63E296|nr:hypothetical protein [Tenacibaculum finnmarkense]MCD8431821.1 hypothetical protein [Tenacibaculum finnmarkense genomovar ulcerans]
MEYPKLEKYLSQPRLDRFLIATGNSKSKAQKLYRINLKTAQAFYPVLNLFEIFFRNIVNHQMSLHFENPNWIITEKKGFMNDSSLGSKFFLKNSIIKAEKIIRRKKGTVTSGKVIAEQSFGFWTSLFDTHHYKLIGGTVIHCFPNKPNYVNRNILNQKLNNIREFRNRVYHNEPICFNGNIINFTEVTNIKNEIYELLEWIDTDLTDYVNYFNGIDTEINRVNNL